MILTLDKKGSFKNFPGMRFLEPKMFHPKVGRLNRMSALLL